MAASTLMHAEFASIEDELDKLRAGVDRVVRKAPPALIDEIAELARRLQRVEDALAGMAAGPSPIIRRMVTYVAYALDVRPSELISSRRARTLAYGRYAIMWAAARLTSYSLPRIAAALGGFDHTTVLYGIRRADELREADPDFRRLTDALLTHFTPRAAPPAEARLLDLMDGRHGQAC